MAFRFETILKLNKNKEDLLQKDLGQINAFIQKQQDSQNFLNDMMEEKKEELKFFDDYEVDAYYPILLALLNTPTILFELFPFIFLITVKFFYIYINERNEIEILKNNGINYFKILSILSIFSISIGIIILIFYYTFSASLKSCSSILYIRANYQIVTKM